MTTKSPVKPPALQDDHLEYLDDLRESGITNMWGASAFLHREFCDLSKQESKDILIYWMDTFSERHPK